MSEKTEPLRTAGSSAILQGWEGSKLSVRRDFLKGKLREGMCATERRAEAGSEGWEGRPLESARRWLP